MAWLKTHFFGILLAAGLAWAAVWLTGYVHLGGVVLAVILGILVGNFAKPGADFQAGIKLCEKQLLGLAIALLGVELNISVLQSLGMAAILYLILAVSIPIAAGILIGRLFSMTQTESLLMGIGNGVCGASAIAGASSVLETPEHETGLSIAIVNFLGVIGMFALPFLCIHALGTTTIGSGILIGGTLQAVGQVTAAGYGMANEIGQIALVVKMGRVLMLMPLLIILLFWKRRRDESQAGNSSGKKAPLKIPRFIIGFVSLAIVANLGILSTDAINIVANYGKILLTIAMAAVGLRITFGHILNDGPKALALGSIVFVIQIISAVIFITLMNY